MGPDHDWPVDVEHMQQPIGRLVVSGLMGVIHKFVLVPTYAPDEKGVLRVISWSFIPRERVLKPEVLKQLELQERTISSETN